MSSENRSRGLLRKVPGLFVAVLFLMVAWSKGFAAYDGVKSFADGVSTYDVVTTVHLMTSGLFFAIVGCLAIVRLEPIRREKRLVGWVLPTAVTVAITAIGWFKPQEYPTSIMFVATAFVVVGTIFTVYSLRHLGRHFGVVSDVRGLVTTGPYRWVRHPLYGGEAITTIGLVIAAANPFSVAAFAIGMTLQVWRAKVEEQALTSVFPEYKNYAEQTPMLIPFVKVPTRALVGSSVTD
jgi:protein-S-isoprenylcysteine O-methyltransferase Ste14